MRKEKTHTNNIRDLLEYFNANMYLSDDATTIIVHIFQSTLKYKARYKLINCFDILN